MIKIYVDGFKVDDIETPEPEEDLNAAALTEKVKEVIGDRIISIVQPTPLTAPKFIMIYTEL